MFTTLSILTLTLLTTSTSAINLYVASYNGNLTTLSLTPRLPGAVYPPSQKPFGWPSSSWPFNHGPPLPLNPASTSFDYDLSTLSTFNTSAQSPSWLLLNKQNNILYLIDEATTSGNGTLASYSTAPQTGASSHPTQLTRLSTLAGGVHAVFFNSGTRMAIPHYTGSSLLVYAIDAFGSLALQQTLTFSMPAPGPVPNRQDSPHPHEALLDPTGRFILVPDLGADLVRIFAIDPTSGALTESASLVATPGSGPRHAAFSIDVLGAASGGEKSYIFYLASEISATITAYTVSYPSASSMSFTAIPGAVYNSLGPGHAVPPTTTGESTGVTAEIALSPDGRFVVVSNRRDLSFNSSTIPSSDIPSDGISVWSLTAAASPPVQRYPPHMPSAAAPTPGALTFEGLFPAGGSYPRQFAINKAGNLVAVGLQESGRVVVWERDVASGAFEREVGVVEGLGQVTCVVWDE
jgi:6-phosphogluconolactonase (cycloisomerase 2 family)